MILVPGHEDAIMKADYYKYSHPDSSYLKKGVNICSQVLEEQPENAFALWMIARFKLALAETRNTRDEKLNIYEEALSYADKAVNEDPA